MFIKKRTANPPGGDAAGGSDFKLFNDGSRPSSHASEGGQVIDMAEVVQAQDIPKAYQEAVGGSDNDGAKAAGESSRPGLRVNRKAPVVQADAAEFPSDEEIKVAASGRKPLFSKKSAKADDAPQDAKSEGKSKGFSWKGGLGKKAVDGASEDKAGPKEKPAKPKKEAKTVASKKSGAKGAPVTSLNVCIELDGGSRVFWNLTENGLVELDQADVTSAVSFSSVDYRFPVEPSTRYAQAQNLVLTEVGEDVRVVLRAKDLQAVYATPAGRIDELNAIELSPGGLLVDTLLKPERESISNFICCLVLKDDESGKSLALLYQGSKDNELSRVQITVNPDDLNFVLSQYAAQRRLDLEAVKVVMLNNADLLKVAHELAAYPLEGVWHGISVGTLWNAAAMLTIAFAVGAGGYAAKSYASMTSTNSRLQAAKAEIEAVKASADDLTAQSLVSFSKAQSMNLKRISERAGAVWTPGSKVTVDATEKSEVYVINLPLIRAGAGGGNSINLVNPVTLDVVEPLIKNAPPEGCTKAIPEISGGLNAVQVSVTCENSDGSLPGYRID